MPRHIVLLIITVAVIFISTPGIPQVDDWLGIIGSPNESNGLDFGTAPWFHDGHDTIETLYDIQGISAVILLFYREHGPAWDGESGFYNLDYKATIPAGGSKTWDDIRLWTQNYTPVQVNRVRVTYTREHYTVPAGYWARLVLDYVPGSLGWTDPWEFIFPLDAHNPGFDLPVPATNNPYDPMQVTRMHLTVYTSPIPEPSSLLALAAGLMAVGLPLIRRRRKQT